MSDACAAFSGRSSVPLPTTPSVNNEYQLPGPAYQLGVVSLGVVTDWDLDRPVSVSTERARSGQSNTYGPRERSSSDVHCPIRELALLGIGVYERCTADKFNSIPHTPVIVLSLQPLLFACPSCGWFICFQGGEVFLLERGRELLARVELVEGLHVSHNLHHRPQCIDLSEADDAKTARWAHHFAILVERHSDVDVLSGCKCRFVRCEDVLDASDVDGGYGADRTRGRCLRWKGR